jgi:hypothetical protein
MPLLSPDTIGEESHLGCELTKHGREEIGRRDECIDDQSLYY